MRTIRDAMTQAVISVRPETPLKEVARLLVDNRISGVPVVDAAGAVLGVVSEADFLTKQLGSEAVTHARFARILGESRATRAQLVKLGAVTAGEAVTGALRQARVCFGGVLDPHAAWLLIRGLRTLELRVARQNATALRIAELLSGDERVMRVHYPFHPSHPQYQLARAYLAAGDAASARREVLKALEEAPSFERAQQLLLEIRGRK